MITPTEAAIFVAEKIALAAKNAWENRQPAYYANEFGRAAVDMCRRVSYDDGSAQMWGDTNTANFVALEGGNDSGIELLYTFDQNKNQDKAVFDFSDNARMHVFAGTIKRYREQQFTEVYPIEFHVIRLGNIAMATNPFELFLDFGNQIKARSQAEQTFIVQLCCSSGGYLPTEKAEKAGHYSAYISSGNVGHEGGDLLVRFPKSISSSINKNVRSQITRPHILIQ